MTYLPPDPARAVKDALDVALPVTVAMRLPTDWTPRSHPAYVVISDDGGDTHWPIVARVLVRVTVYAAGRTQARELAAQALSTIMDGDIPGVIRPPRRAPTITDARDPATEAVVSGFTIPIRMRVTVVP